MGGRVIVIGAGAAGLMAAGRAAQLGVETVLLEKKGRPGQKLRITGHGRCNLTNWDPLPEFITRFGRNGRFLRSAFSQFFAPELVAFFKQLGVRTVTEGKGTGGNGRVYPASGRAQDVVDALVRWTEGCGVRFVTRSPVERLVVEKGRVVGVAVEGGQVHRCDSVVIATGGASYPATGSAGDGCRLAAAVGHTIVTLRPALVPLETAGDVARRLQGVSLSDVSVRVLVDGKVAAGDKRRSGAAGGVPGGVPGGARGEIRDETRGELLFTHFGVSGPVILRLSKLVADDLLGGASVTLSLDLKPDLNEHGLDGQLLAEVATHGRRKARSLLKTLLPGKLGDLCADLTGISPDKPASQVTADERKRLRTWLKDFRLEVTGHRPISEAILTAGGVDLREVDPRTMASRLVKGLYFAGEVLDIDGASGGYNLQAAFSTGWVAGRAAAARPGVSGTRY
jgi:predicted flavoprotein YhiN